jgi:hypothetical protein
MFLSKKMPRGVGGATVGRVSFMEFSDSSRKMSSAPIEPNTFVPQYSIPSMALIPAIAAGSGSAVLLLMLLIACCKFRCKKSSRESKFELLEESQSFLEAQNSMVRLTN